MSLIDKPHLGDSLTKRATFEVNKVSMQFLFREKALLKQTISAALIRIEHLYTHNLPTSDLRNSNYVFPTNHQGCFTHCF